MNRAAGQVPRCLVRIHLSGPLDAPMQERYEARSARMVDFLLVVSLN